MRNLHLFKNYPEHSKLVNQTTFWKTYCNSKNIFVNFISCMLIQSSFNNISEQASQGMDIAYNLDLGKWDGIVICSGDGLAYEVMLEKFFL